MEDVYWERLEKKMELNSKQVALITHRIDGGEFSPHEVYHRLAAKDFCPMCFLTVLLCIIYCGHSVCRQYLEASKTALLFGFAV